MTLNTLGCYELFCTLVVLFEVFIFKISCCIILPVNNPLNPPGVGWVNLFYCFKVRVSIRTCVPNLGSFRRPYRKCCLSNRYLYLGLNLRVEPYSGSSGTTSGGSYVSDCLAVFLGVSPSLTVMFSILL